MPYTQFLPGATGQLPIASGTAGTLLLIDWNKDGLNDVVFVAAAQGAPQQVALTVYDGAHGFAQVLAGPYTLPVSAGPLASFSAWLLADLNGDGTLDLAGITLDSAGVPHLHVFDGAAAPPYSTALWADLLLPLSTEGDNMFGQWFVGSYHGDGTLDLLAFPAITPTMPDPERPEALIFDGSTSPPFNAILAQVPVEVAEDDFQYTGLGLLTSGPGVDGLDPPTPASYAVLAFGADSAGTWPVTVFPLDPAKPRAPLALGTAPINPDVCQFALGDYQGDGWQNLWVFTTNLTTSGSMEYAVLAESDVLPAQPLPASQPAVPAPAAAGPGRVGGAAGPPYPVPAPPSDGVYTFVFLNDPHLNNQISGRFEAISQLVAAINTISTVQWPTGTNCAGQPIGDPLFVLVNGDLTDKTGGLTFLNEAPQLRDFCQLFNRGETTASIIYPTFIGLGNHDLDWEDWWAYLDWGYNRGRMWAHIAAYHSNVQGPFPEGPFQTVTAIDASWTTHVIPPPTYSSFNYLIDFPATADSKGLSVLQLHRFAGDAQKNRASGVQWYQNQVQAALSQNKALVIAQHYGWDDYSVGNWWSDTERATTLAPLTTNGAAYKNIVGIFHGHNHTPQYNYPVPGTQNLWAIDPGGALLGYLGVCRISNITDPANGQMQIDMAFGHLTPTNTIAFDHVWSTGP